MSDMPPAAKAVAYAKAHEAILHLLGQIKEREHVAWYLGIGTQSFALLTEALAAITEQPLEEVEKAWRPIASTNPYEQGAEEAIIDAGEDTPDDIAQESLEAERRAMRKPILDMLDLFPCLTGINWATTDTDQLLELVHQHILRDRKALESSQ